MRQLGAGLGFKLELGLRLRVVKVMCSGGDGRGGRGIRC